MVKFLINKKAKKSEALSIITTLLIILGLVIAGPVEAVKINVKTDKPVYSKDDSAVTFQVSIDIQKYERVPIKELALKINDGYKVCEFSPDGSNSCDNIEITLLNPGQEEQGSLMGKGNGFVNESDNQKNQETNFGFGYGYGEQPGKSGLNGELKYEIVWNIADEKDLPQGKFKATLEAYDENEGTHYTYTSKKVTNFFIGPNPQTTVTDQATIKAKDGEINDIKGLSEFNKVDALFNAEIKKLSSDELRGATTLSLYGEKEDTTKVKLYLEIRSDGYTQLTEFTEDKIEFAGNAKFEYSKTKIGKWANGKREGSGEKESLAGNIEVNVNIEDGKVTVSSDDEKIKFNVELPITSFNYKEAK